MTRIALIDYGAGNLRSVANALAAAGASGVEVTADPAVVARADRIILPGVGAFGASMTALAAVPDLVPTMARRVREEGAPFLGICVGMQLLADAGEEHGRHDGLGWIGGTVRALAPGDPSARVPHMGWNGVEPCGAASLVERGEAYFLHGYALTDCPASAVAATTDHGGTVIAAVQSANVAGVQFHPEKSQRYGIATLERFLQWRP